MYGSPRGRRADRDPERRGRAHDAVRRRVHEGRPAARRRAGEAAVRHEPREHDLLDQALHGAQVQRGHRRDDDDPVQGRQGPERGRSRQGRRHRVRAAGALGDDPPEAEGRRGGLPRRAGHGRRRHRPGLLQQRAARGDQGRRQDRGAQRSPHHQRADRGRPRLQPGEGRRPEDPRVRPRRRHVRRVGARVRRRDRDPRGARHERRQPPRRRQLRQGDRRLDGRRVQARAGHRSLPGQDGAPAALRGRGEGQDRALLDAVDADQPAVRHRDAGGAEAP